jgi:acetylornithine deacetylase/succinyl-diaminopimelate desuccinylase-like protein
MSERSDALVTASRLITAVRDAAIRTGLGVATVGVINSDTSSKAAIPAGIDFIIDIRCSTDSEVDQLATIILHEFDCIIHEKRNQTTYKVVKTWGLPEPVFDRQCIEAVRSAALKHVTEKGIMEMKSRAGHDSAWTSRVVSTSMIFVPSKGDTSHNPNEYTCPEHCALGAQVMLDAVLHYDKRAKQKDLGL